MKSPRRALRHLLFPDWQTRRAFPRRTRIAIADAVAKAEKQTRGELRFVAEGGLALPLLWRNVEARRRAIDLFSTLRVWDTEENSGVLIYVQLADRRVEIVADRGIHARVGDAPWRAICRDMEKAFAEGRFEAGAINGIGAIGALLAAHFPASDQNPNELSDAPTIL